jgi:hypothetical protein
MVYFTIFRAGLHWKHLEGVFPSGKPGRRHMKFACYVCFLPPKEGWGYGPDREHDGFFGWSLPRKTNYLYGDVRLLVDQADFCYRV